jgi:hypothetical protein
VVILRLRQLTEVAYEKPDDFSLGLVLAVSISAVGPDYENAT